MCFISLSDKEINQSFRYHHVLKSHYLGGKHNWRVDHVIRMLVEHFLPKFKFTHLWQLTRIYGPNLEKLRRLQIKATARNMSLDSIHHLGGTKFNVASESHLGHYYLINLNASTCVCEDFLRIQFCKHIAAIHEHFPPLASKRSSHSKILEHMRVPAPAPAPALAPAQPQRAPEPEEIKSVDILLKDINALCQQLSTLSDCSTTDLKALKHIKYSLRAVIALANRSQPLSEKDIFNPNQKTWAKTAQCMGARKPPKQKHGPADENNAERCIGPVKGKCAHKYTDPYAGGKRSGKHAKPDAVSSAANERTRAAMCAVPMHAPPHAPLVLAPTHMSPSAAAAGSTACYSTCGNPSTVVPFAFPPPSAVPRLTFAPLSTTLPGHASTSPSAAAVGSAACYSTHRSPSTAIPFAFWSLSAAPGDAFASFSAASSGHTFAPPSATGPGSRYAGATSKYIFQVN